MEELSFYPVPMLLRDFPGYRIGIHGDSLSKAITAQFYLPLDASQSRLGTILHEGREGEAAGHAKRLPFRPATGYAFPVMLSTPVICASIGVATASSMVSASAPT